MASDLFLVLYKLNFICFLMPRSKWKLPYLDPSLSIAITNSYRLLENSLVKDDIKLSRRKQKRFKKGSFHTMSRQTLIQPSMIGLLLHVHSGHRYTPVKIRPAMVGRKLGEFSPTRKVVIHKLTKKK